MSQPQRAGPEARITPLTDVDQAGTVLSDRSVRASAAVAFTPMYALLVVIPTGIVVELFAEPFLGDASRIVAIAGSVSMFALVIGYLHCFSDYLPSRYFYRRSRAVIVNRPDAIVDVDDPEAIYIQVIPREHWGRQMLENASDVGFLAIDEANRRLVYEGDSERWVIPAAAIRSLDIEVNEVGSRFPLLVLTATVGGQLWEAPISPRHIFFRPRRLKERWGEVRWLRRKIRRILPAGWEATG